MRHSRGMGAVNKPKLPKSAGGATSEAHAGGDWIKDAVNPKNKGALRRALGAKPGKPIPALKLATAVKKPGITGKRARLARTLKKF